MARGEETDGSRKTEYAWDTLASEEVHVGYKEDWPDDANRNQDWRGVTPLRTGAEKAEHGDGSARYRCCKNPRCASAVSVAQKAVNKWHFRRMNDSSKPPVCERREHYVGESSYHWKTTLQIKKLLEHKMRTKTKWLGRTIMHVEREEVRFFSTGKFGARLKPDIYVRFTDGDWLVVEVVYTHAPDRDNHDAYNHSFSSSNRFGPRIIELNLNQFIDGRITDKSHAQWVREGGMEEALAFESELENRTERFENRKMKFDERERRKRNRAVESAVASCHADFPGLSHLTPEISNDEDLQTIEDFFVNSHRIHTVFGVLVEENGTDFGLDPQQMNSVEDVKASFKEFNDKLAKSREIIQTLTQKISKLEETYPGVYLPPEFKDLKDPALLIESLNEFESSLNEKEQMLDACNSKIERLYEHINLRIGQVSESGAPQEILNKMQKFVVDIQSMHPSGFDVESLQIRFDAHCKKIYAEALSKELGIGFKWNMTELSLEDTLIFWEKARKFKIECDKARNEKLSELDISKEVYEELNDLLSEITINYNDGDLKKYNEEIQLSITKWEIDAHVRKSEERHDIIVPERLRFDSKEQVDEWFAQSLIYRDECEEFRQDLLRIMEKSGKKANSYQVQNVQKERPNYNERSFAGFEAKLKRLRNQTRPGEYLDHKGRKTRDEPLNPFVLDAAEQRNQKRKRKKHPNQWKPKRKIESEKKEKEGMSKKIPPNDAERLAELRKNSAISSKSKLASKDMTPEEDQQGYLKARLEKLRKEINRSGLTAKQHREAQGNLDRFVKANKGKYENDES